MQAQERDGKQAIDLYRDELRRTIQNVHNLIFKYKRGEDGSFIFTLSEGKLARDFGLTTESIGQKKLQEILLTCNEEKILPLYERAYAGQIVEYEASIGDRIFTTTLAPITDSGDVVEVVGSLTEITERKQMERELKETEELYRSLVEDTLVGVYIAYVNEPGFVYVNPHMADMFGYTQEELMKLGMDEVILPVETADEKTNSHENTSHSMRYPFRGLRKDGSTVELEVLQKTTVYKGLPAVIGILLDVTERKQAEEMLRKSEMLSIIGQLAAGVAHEIRNPLTSLEGFLHLLQSRYEDKPKYYDIMLSELNRIEHIVSEFLVLAKPHNVVFNLHDIRPMLEQIILLAETHAIMHDVQIVTKYDADLPPVRCEENQLKQVFLNLLKNAIEAMPDGGEVHVEVEREDNVVVVRFRDHGCGIPEDRLPKLGEPFFTTKEKGTGLGLMVSYKIINSLGGKITVKSKEREGSTFEVRLPVV
ncbi:PAS domain S-box protein [Brevibacillus borstelensis]|uniref:ATP-binding protein n=1 Tax=Brevibacillus borstelensis TaxID=45462 RepID=UPI002E22D9E7|nr:PAS domain S-box protein [Brevibacillus borstelensis]